MYENLIEYVEKTYRKKLEDHKKKQECPKCGHKTFQMYEDNKKATCFHPSCGLHLNFNVINGDIDYRCIVAERFAAKAHSYLFTQDQTVQPI